MDASETRTEMDMKKAQEGSGTLYSYKEKTGEEARVPSELDEDA